MLHARHTLSSTFSQRVRAAIAAVGAAVALTFAANADAQAGMTASTYAKVGTSYVATATATIKTAPLDVRGNVKDLSGFSQFTMSFAGNKASSCTTNNGTVYNGSFYVSLPATQTVNPAPWPLANVTRDATIAAPKCTVLGQPGIPWGHSFTMTVKGTDYDSSVITKTMTIKVG